MAQNLGQVSQSGRCRDYGDLIRGIVLWPGAFLKAISPHPANQYPSPGVPRY